MSAPISQADWERFRRESIEIMPELAETLGLPDVLLAYQSKAVGLIDSTAMRVLFIEKSRRIGLTWGLASYAVLRASRRRSAKGMDVLYISYKQEIAKEFVDVCGMWARAFAVAAADVDEVLFDDVDLSNPEDTKQIQAYRIRFASGFQILALSSAPRSLRGQQGDVIIDEAAFVDSLKQLMKAALAMRMWPPAFRPASACRSTRTTPPTWRPRAASRRRRAAGSSACRPARTASGVRSNGRPPAPAW